MRLQLCEGGNEFESGNDRQIRQDGVAPDKIDRPLFGPVARLVWPFKTAAHLAAIAGTSERAAARWLSGEIEPPGLLLAALLTEITKRK